MANATDTTVTVTVPAAPDVKEFFTPILTGEWLTWDDEQAGKYSATLHAFVGLVGIVRQRHDEQVDTVHNMGKLSKVTRIRKARNSEDKGPKVDPLAEALAALNQ